MKHLILLFACFTLSSISTAQTQRKIKGSSVTFKIKNAGSWVDGSFGKVSGTIKFDEKATTNSIDASVEAASLNTKNEKRDKHVKSDDFLDAEKAPLIRIVSQKITPKDDGTYEGDFKITMRTTSKDVKIPFTYKNGILSATFSINRRDYGVGGRNLILSDEAFVIVVIATE
ncbi:MAG: YceI family protein [Bacteroidia bacterium]